MKCEYCLGVFCWYGVLVHSQKDMTTVNRLQHVKAIWNDLNGTARKLCQVSLPNPEALLCRHQPRHHQLCPDCRTDPIWKAWKDCEWQG